jgi:mRNA interferase RelE/StbE
MTFNVWLHPKANEFIEKADKRVAGMIKARLKELSDPSEKGKRLKHSNFWSLRIGDYRAIYEIDQQKEQVVVLFIGHRKIYEDFSKII